MPPERTFLAVIPARGGSKRLPRKNLLELAGKPLLAWTIEAALQSQCIERVVVSTDDGELARIAFQHGADVPFMRPEALARDDSASLDVLKYTLQELEKSGERYRYVVLLQPTSPLRNAGHIDAAIRLLFEKQADAVVSVAELEHPLEWCNTLPENLALDGFLPARYRGLRSQDLPKRYRLNGAIYISNVERLRRENALVYDGKSFAYIMDRESSVDIDSEIDFLLAEILIKRSLASSAVAE